MKLRTSPDTPDGRNGRGPGQGTTQGKGRWDEHYLSRPVRPAALLAARIGLWGAVALGCVGGCVGLVRPASGPAEPAVQGSGDGEVVPAPVAGVAQVAVTAWLTAASEQQAERLGDLFLFPPSPTDVDTGGLRVVAVTPVAGRRIADGYWSVTFAAELTEDRRSEGADGELETERVPLTWYVEVGVVGEVDGGLSALATPAIVPPPSPSKDGWVLAVNGGQTPEADDPMVTTTTGFLRALLAGDGEPERYASPDVEVVGIDPVPFADLALLQMTTVELDDGRVRAWARAQATTEGGARQVLAYELLLELRAGRWEVADFAGVPSLSAMPDLAADEPVATDEPGATEGAGEAGDNNTGASGGQGGGTSPGSTAAIDAPVTTAAAPSSEGPTTSLGPADYGLND